MIFCIQASTPKFGGSIKSSDTTVAEAIESVFPMDTENAIMMWNHICIPISYKYDISYMMDDIVKLIGAIQNKERGKSTIHWLPDTFRCEWQVEWNDGVVCVCSKWECTVGHLETLLNEKNKICLPTSDFVNEWKSVLGTVINGLKNCNPENIEICGISELIKQYKNINGNGIMYRTRS